MENEELRAAEERIAQLEEELLRLKDVKRELETLRTAHQQLRRSVAGRTAKILAAPFRFLSREKQSRAEASEYERWLARHRTPEEQLPSLHAEAANFAYQPLVSILTPTFNPDENHLTAAIRSVVAQVYENWELIVVDDASERASPILPQLEQRDRRIRVLMEKQHGGISAALNVALAHTRGDWIALLDHDDLLEPDALFRAIELLQTNRTADVIYSDEDKIIDGRFAAPMLKPAWSPDLFLTHDYLGHFVLLRRDFVEPFRSEFDGAQDYELLLRICEKTNRIQHIPRVLYHWRRTAQSTAHNIRRKPGALEAGRRAITEHLERCGERARVTVDWATHVYRVRREPRGASIAILLSGQANDNLAPAVRARTAYPDFEILVEPGALFNTKADLLVFLDANLEPLREDWLAALAEQITPEEIGAVGARILGHDNKVESAGLVLLPEGIVRAAFAGMARDYAGANRQMQMVRNYTALSPSCLMTRRALWQELAAAPGRSLASRDETERTCAAVEYCLDLNRAGRRVVSTPYAELRRTGDRANVSVSCAHLKLRWPEAFERDPFYHPNLSRERADFSLGDPQP